MKAKFGRYVFLKKLAVGGMAEIFLARRLSFGGFAKFVVLKRLLPEHRGKRAYEQLFLTEARIHAVLNHPHIVSLHDLGKLDDAFFMAMEYVHGVSGAELMARAAQRRKPLPRGAALRVVTTMAEALHYGHETLDDLGEDAMRILHHDVSPHNIQVGYDGATKLLDYGVATRVGHPAPGGRRGKPAYMSPEAIEKRELDHRSDLFSLAIVLYEMTLSRRLFKAATPKETMARARAAQVKPPREIDSAYPVELERVVLKALSRDPADRYPDGRALADALRAVAEAEGIDTSQEAFAAYLADLFKDDVARRQAELAALARASRGGNPAAPKPRPAAEAKPPPPPPPKPAPPPAEPEPAPEPEAADAVDEPADESIESSVSGISEPPAPAPPDDETLRQAPEPPADGPGAPVAEPADEAPDGAGDDPAASHEIRATLDQIAAIEAAADDPMEPEDSDLATIVKSPEDFALGDKTPTPSPVEPDHTPTPAPEVADVGDGRLELDLEAERSSGEYDSEEAVAFELPEEAHDQRPDWDDGTYSEPLRRARRLTWIVALLAVLVAGGAFFAGQRLPTLLSPTGRITIESEPAGATVISNGKPIGKTPLAIEGLSVGDTKLLKIEKTGHGAVERKITIYPDRLSREWTVTLPRR